MPRPAGLFLPCAAFPLESKGNAMPDFHCVKHLTFQSVCDACQQAKKDYWRTQVRELDEPDRPALQVFKMVGAPPNEYVVPVKVAVKYSTGDPVVDLCLAARTARKTSLLLDQFLDYHQKNPGIFDFLVAALQEMQDAGYVRGGFPLAYNQARWHYGVKKRNTEFELNNNIAAHYSRAVAILHPELEGFYEMRTTAGGTADRDFGYTPKKKSRAKGTS